MGQFSTPRTVSRTQRHGKYHLEAFMILITLLDAISGLNDSMVWNYLRDRPKSFGIPHWDKMTVFVGSSLIPMSVEVPAQRTV